MRPIRRHLQASEDQAVTFVELFFDLVFVFAVTQVTSLTANHLTWNGIARSVLLFWLIWWAWTQFTWTLNPADTDHDLVRVITLVATAIAFVMATAVSVAFSADVWWFVVPYVLVRLLGLGLQVRIDLEHSRPDDKVVGAWAALSTVGLVLVLAGATVDPPARTWIWLVAIIADLVAAGSGAAGGRAWDIRPAHFSERHGLFVIIALGESLIIAGTAVADQGRTSALMGVVIAALVVACLLWWSYFGWLKQAVEHGFASTPADHIGAVARDAFSLGHFPLLCGIIAFAAAIEEMVRHPAEPASTAVVVALGAGIALFIGSSALAYWRTCHRVLGARLLVLAISLGALWVVAEEPPIWPLAVIGAGLAVIVAIEAVVPRPAGSELHEAEIPPSDT